MDGPASRDAFVAGEQALAAGDPTGAEALFRQAARERPSDPRPHVALARLHVAQRRFAGAVEELGAALAIRETADTLVLRGRALGLDRRFDEAARDLDRAVALDPRSVEAWAILAAVQVNRGDAVEAERAFTGAAAASDRLKAADRVWTHLLAMPPDPVAPQETLDRCTRGVAAGLQGEWAEAERELRNGLRYAPGYSWCAAQWAESLARGGDLGRAERTLRRAIQGFAPPQGTLRADAEGRLAALLVSSGKAAPEAVRLARGALAVRGDRVALLFILGRACEAAGDAACAGDAYGRMLEQPHVPAPLRTVAEERARSMGGGPATSR